MKIRAALTKSEELARTFDREVNGLEFPATDRARLSAALLDQAHEHHKAILELIGSELIGSAFSLTRALFETSIRGAWLYRCASEEQVEHFKTDPKDLTSLGNMITAVETLYGTEGGFLSRVKKDYWSSLSSYAHGGYLQAVRRLTPETIAASYSEEEQLEVISFADFCYYFSAIEIFSLSGREDLAQSWSANYSRSIAEE